MFATWHVRALFAQSDEMDRLLQESCELLACNVCAGLGTDSSAFLALTQSLKAELIRKCKATALSITQASHAIAALTRSHFPATDQAEIAEHINAAALNHGPAHGHTNQKNRRWTTCTYI